MQFLLGLGVGVFGTLMIWIGVVLWATWSLDAMGEERDDYT